MFDLGDEAVIGKATRGKAVRVGDFLPWPPPLLGAWGPKLPQTPRKGCQARWFSGLLGWLLCEAVGFDAQQKMLYSLLKNLMGG